MLPVGHFEHQGSQIKGFGRLNKFRELLFSGCLRAAVSTVKPSEFAVTPVLPHTILHVTLDHSLTDDVTVTPTNMTTYYHTTSDDVCFAFLDSNLDNNQ